MKMFKGKGISYSLLILCLFFFTLVAGCGTKPGSPDGDAKSPEEESVALSKTQEKENNNIELALGANFAPYREVAVDYTPAIPNYQVAPGLTNVSNLDSFGDAFGLTPSMRKILETNGFVVMPAQEQEFFMLYEINRYAQVPNFITTDSMLHNYHLFFSHLLRVVEKDELVPELKKLTTNMLSASKDQYALLQGTDWANAAKRNMGFFAVAGQLLDPSLPIPKAIEQEVQGELALIRAHSGIAPSPLMNMGQNLGQMELFQEDYSQYLPRGHYDRDEALQSYFKAMVWYGRMTFRLHSPDETKSAVLMTLALEDKDMETSWQRIYEPTNFFVGKADDLSHFQYKDLLNEVYGQEVEIKELPANGDKWGQFFASVGELEPPVINSIPIFDEELQPDKEEAITGFRFMGQRYTLDGEIFQKLVYRSVKESHEGKRRMLPRALDIPAAFGSQEALAILLEEGAGGYPGYEKNMGQLQDYIGNLGKETWQENLYWNWLYTLKSLLGTRGEGYPQFMQNKAWQRKDLQTFLGSWTELKHDTVLYAKQVYAEMGGGGIEIDDRGYVEPNPQLYGRLAALVAMTREGLLARDLIGLRDRENLDRMEELALYLKTISEKELANTSLSQEEYDLIRSYGGQLEHFWLEALADMGVDHRSAIYDNPAALIADVATDPEGWVLQEGTGYVFDIYVIVPVDGGLRLARGGVYSHYEFPWPMEDRLTDGKWHAILDAGKEPPLASWTEDFITP